MGTCQANVNYHCCRTQESSATISENTDNSIVFVAIARVKRYSLYFNKHVLAIYFEEQDYTQIKTISELHGQINISYFFPYVKSLLYAFFFFKRLTIVLEKGHQMMLRNVIHIFISHSISFYNCSSMKCERAWQTAIFTKV